VLRHCGFRSHKSHFVRAPSSAAEAATWRATIPATHVPYSRPIGSLQAPVRGRKTDLRRSASCVEAHPCPPCRSGHGRSMRQCLSLTPTKSGSSNKHSTVPVAIRTSLTTLPPLQLRLRTMPLACPVPTTLMRIRRNPASRPSPARTWPSRHHGPSISSANDCDTPSSDAATVACHSRSMPAQAATMASLRT
jgi:hypothetical protein